MNSIWFHQPKTLGIVAALAAVVFGFQVSPASAAPIVYEFSGAGSWQLGTLGNSGGTFYFTFDGGDTSTVGANSGGFQYSNNPMTGTVALYNGSGLVYSGAITYGSSITLNTNAGYLGLYNSSAADPEPFSFAIPALTSASLTDIGYSLTVLPLPANSNFYSAPQFLPIGAGGPLDYVTLLSISSLTFSEVAGAVPEPSTWAMLLVGFAGLGFTAYRKAIRQKLNRVSAI